MAVDFTPRPTEYKGVVYRSKSEAYVARWLEIEVEQGHLHGFCYEPKHLRVGEWVPDFMGWEVMKVNNELGLKYVFLEYKPKPPTATYLRELATRANKLEDIASRQPHCGGICFILLCGGFFGNPPKWIAGEKRNGKVAFVEKDYDWLPFHIEQKIKLTRFDLEASYGR